MGVVIGAIHVYGRVVWWGGVVPEEEQLASSKVQVQRPANGKFPCERRQLSMLCVCVRGRAHSSPAL